MMEDEYTIKSLNLTEQEIEIINKQRLKHVANHELCGGVGVISIGGEYRECTCVRSLRVYKLLVHSRVPGAFRLRSIECGDFSGIVNSRGRTSALVAAVMRGVAAGNQRCMYCTAHELSGWCLDERSEVNAMYLDRGRGCGLLAVDDLDRLTDRYKSLAAPNYLRSLRDNGTALIGAGFPADEWAVFGKVVDVGWKSEKELEFLDLADAYYGI